MLNKEGNKIVFKDKTIHINDLNNSSENTTFLNYIFQDTFNTTDTLDISSINKMFDSLEPFVKLNPYNVIKFIGIINEFTGFVSEYSGVTFDIDDFILNGIPEAIEEAHSSLNKDDIYTTSAKIVDLYKELTDHFYNKGYHIGALVKSGTRGNIFNIGNSFLSYGYRIDSESFVSPHYTEASLFDGLESERDFYNSALSSRNALLQAVDAIPASGYIYRKLSQLLLNVKLDERLDFCGSTNLLNVYLTENNLHYYLGRNVLLNNMRVTLTLDNVERYKLLNTEVQMYTPVTCKSSDKHVCKTCMGQHSKGLENYSNIGIFTAMIFSSIITQSLLSAKHQQFVTINRLSEHLSEFMYYDFNIDTNEITFKLKCDIEESKFSFIEQYLAPYKEVELLKNYTKNSIVIRVLDNTVKNIDMNSALSELESLLECYRENSNITDFQVYYNRFISFIQKMNIKVDSIHVELILSQMARNTNKASYLFNERQDEDYTILGITKSLLSKSNIFDLLVFERIKDTLSNPELILGDSRNEVSELETFFLTGE